MSRFTSKETVARLREQYHEGARVELISIEDPYINLIPGERGSVSLVDDAGTIFVAWDSGVRLGVAYGVDHVKRIENEIGYKPGAYFFQNIVSQYGLDEALLICGRYLPAYLKTQRDNEKQFCRGLFEAMYERTKGSADLAKLVYPYTFEKAGERREFWHYDGSRTYNNQCAAIIDTAIQQSCYARDHYNLDMAVMVAAHDYGFERVQAVLAQQIQRSLYDGRYSLANKEWAKGIDLPAPAFESAVINAHPILIDGFSGRFRELYRDMNAERDATPGTPESGDGVQEYQINRSVWFDSGKGFAVGHSQKDAAPYVCWQFTAENGKREYYWGTYTQTEKEALDNLTARVIVYMTDEDVREIPNPLTSSEMKAAQSHEKAAARSSHTLPAEKPSVMEKLREAKKAPPAPRKQNDGHGKGGLEL